MSKTESALLRFDPSLNKLTKGKELRHGLSVAVQVGDTLWVTNDETISLERLSRDKDDPGGDYNYGKHEQFSLAKYLDLPERPKEGKKIEEADVEGLDYRDGYLWLVGSHSLKRKKPDKETVEENFEELSDVSSDGNRYLLARIPLVEKDGAYTLEPESDRDGKKRVAAQLHCGKTQSDLTKALAEDRHLGGFLSIPGKDNGFDIEGLAVTDDGRVFIGLRGPVLRGWAVVLQLELEEDGEKAPKNNAARLKLKAVNPGDPASPAYRKHFLNLGGLGIRDLCLHGSDLLILAGPTMDLDGPVTAFRWKEAAHLTKESLVPRDELEKVMDIPYGQGEDHAEGITLFSPGGGEPGSLMVVYDSASKDRQLGDSGMKADIFALPERR
jgi:hypothetical protein